MGPPNSRRSSIVELEYMLQNHFPQFNHIVHDGSLPLPAYIKDIDWNGIVLGSTFLCKCIHPNEFKKTLIDYAWIKNSSAIKIALPQDDYDCSQILDNWMTDWNIDLLFSVLTNNLDVIYPKYSKVGKIRLAYTGYISKKWILKWKKVKAHNQRSIDVSYRASDLPENFGKIGKLKSLIATRFLNSVKHKNLILDISTRNEDLIPGDKWHDFLEDSKFCLATPSGSSLLDPTGEYRKNVYKYKLKNPFATFEEVENACFFSKDGKYEFTAISPRNIEAALAQTVQIATPGNYSNIMNPVEHYIPLNEDCSNIDEVVRMMNDSILIHEIKKNLKEKIINTPDLYLNNFASKIIDFIKDNTHNTNQLNDNNKLINKYRNEFDVISERYWKNFYFKNKIKKTLKKIGAKKIKTFFQRIAN